MVEIDKEWLSTATVKEVLLLVFIDNIKLWIAGGITYVLLAVLGFALWPWQMFGILDNRQFKVALAGFVIALVCVGWLAIWGVKRIWDPRRIYIIRVNLTKSKPIDIKIGTPERWQEVDIVSGEPVSFDLGGYSARLVTDFERVETINPDDELWDHIPTYDNGKPQVSGWVATGSWLGEASDAEIARTRHQIEANRRRNNLWARLGEKILSKVGKIAEDVERRHHHDLQQQERELTLYQDTVSDALADEIPEYEELNTEQGVGDIIEEEVSRQIEEMNTPSSGSLYPGDKESTSNE